VNSWPATAEEFASAVVDAYAIRETPKEVDHILKGEVSTTRGTRIVVVPDDTRPFGSGIMLVLEMLDESDTRRAEVRLTSNELKELIMVLENFEEL
jgi:predicted ATP-dependent serine protease